MHTHDVVKRQNNKNKFSGAHRETKYDFHDHSRRFDVRPKEFIGIKLQQTVFLTGLDKYIGTDYNVHKGFR